MPNEKRLIDANAFLKDILTAGIGKTIIEYSESDIGYMIRKRPTVDAVEVVRKPVVGYEGYYEVDQFGRVFSVERVISVDDNGRKYEKPVSGKQMKQCLKNNGYKSVSLTKGGVTKAFYVHRLVAEAFIPNPDNLPMVNHKDEDKTNNFLENIEWCTAQYNNTYGNKAKRQANKIRGIAHSNEHKKKITSSLLKYYETHDSASIGRISEKRKGVVGVRNGESVQFQSVKDAAIAVNGSRANITRSCNSKTRKAYGYKWTWAGDRKEGAEMPKGYIEREAAIEAAKHAWAKMDKEEEQ